jgi:hypothetical protein
MNKAIALPLLADPRTGGWPTYTAHLARGLLNIGWDPIIFRVKNKSETKPRDFGGGLTYWNISEEDLRRTCKDIPTLITAVGKNYRAYARSLFSEGASVVIHDPTELDAEMRDALGSVQVFTIRPIISIGLRLAGIDNSYLPHPYERSVPITESAQTRAVSLSRIDWDKNTDIIVEANKVLPPDKKIRIYGAPNRLYMHLSLKELDADWEENYAGSWPANADSSIPIRIAKSADMVVDLSSIKGDGGGTQYSFLEVFDAERPLIVHQKWLTGNADYDEIRPAIYKAVSGADSLVEAILGEPEYDADAANRILAAHDAGTVAKQLIEMWNRG